MISVDHLVKDFGARRAVDDVTFEVEKGTVLGFLGPNGAGKSTTMRMITGFIKPTSGTAVIDGHDIVKSPVHARSRFGYLPESAPSYRNMTVREFLRFMAEMRGFKGPKVNAVVDGTIEKCFLEEVRNQTIETLSKGYRQRTCFAQAILHDPPVLIMDEPTDGLDPNQKHVVREMIKEMAAEKVIILSTHVLEEVGAICNRIIIINSGKVVKDAKPAELAAEGKLEDVFRRLTQTEDTNVSKKVEVTA
ncbi:MAG: ABC-2 type transport system ATP-binding protein [Kiritimatiellia bacterium]|jgi:ABC-2 type transport system ATP-binding protein